MTAIQQVTALLDAAPRGLTVRELVATTGRKEWTVRGAIHKLQVIGCVETGDVIKRGHIGRPRVRYFAINQGIQSRRLGAA